jgi:chromosome segregation ATPase
VLAFDLQALIGDDNWALALEVAIGKLLNAFVVTSHRDMLLLRDCAKSCGYNSLQIVIYDYDRPL